MEWAVEYTDEFETWWKTLSEKEQTAGAVTVGLLERMGPGLPFPHSSSVHGSRHGHMRELRTQCDGHPLRTLYAFDPRRVAILLIGGDKTGDDRWYESFVPLADRLYDEHLKEIALNVSKKKGGFIMAKKFSSLRKGMSEEAQAEVAGRVDAIMAEMPLHELRRARGLSQKMLAENLRVQQPAIAKLEQRTDMYISTLRSHIEAMGGELEITARFPEGTVKISNFSQLEPSA